MNLETKITIYKFTPQVFTLTRVYEEHKEHGECAEYIYRSHSLEC